MRNSSVSLTDVCALSIFGLINTLVVYKYSSRIISPSWTASLLYLVLFGLFVWILYRNIDFSLSLKTKNLIYLSLIALFSIGLTILMFHFDPEKIRVGRYPAIHDWLTRLFQSQFPYASPARPSGFPFLFVMALPFYFLGDLGLLQIFSFLTFAVLVHLRYGQRKMNGFRCIFLLITAPIFLYEIVVRSDLFSNMVLVMLYLAIFELVSRKATTITLYGLGIMAGLLLSTRGIVLLIFILFFGYLLAKRIFSQGLFYLSMLVGFCISLVPFLIWDPNQFMKFGPFSIQLSTPPIWLVILSVAFSIYCALNIGSLKKIYSSISFLLFGVVCAAFVLKVLDYGWYAAVMGDGFDISYFSFSVPFLLISLNFQQRDVPAIDNMFAIPSAFVPQTQALKYPHKAGG